MARHVRITFVAPALLAGIAVLAAPPGRAQAVDPPKLKVEIGGYRALPVGMPLSIGFPSYPAVPDDGTQPANHTFVNVWNKGRVDAHISNWRITGPQASSFTTTVPSEVGGTLAPRSIAQADVRFSPVAGAPHRQTATLSFVTDDPTQPA